MSDHEHLRSIARLIKAQDYEQARRELQGYLTSYPDDAQGWYLLSLATPEQRQKVLAAQRALKLDPGFTRARERLDLLRAAPQPQKRRGRIGRWTATILLAAGIVGAGVVFALTRPSDDSAKEQPIPTLFQAQPLPTSVALAATATDVPTDTAEPTLTRTAKPTLTQTATPTLTAAASRTPEPTRQVTATRTLTLSPTATLPPQTPTPTTPPPASNTPFPMATQAALALASPATGGDNPPTPNLVLPPTSALSGSPVPSATPLIPPTRTPLPPTATFIAPGSIIPINTLASLTGGQMMVVSAVRPAGSTIRELGGTAPNPPSGTEWLLAEILVHCQDGACSLASASIQVAGASGTTYAPSSSLQIDPAFGPGAAANGQAWGYLGFTVPPGDAPFYLVVTQGTTLYHFALQ